MGTPAIRVQRVGKRYQLGVTHARGRVSEYLQHALTTPLRALGPGRGQSHLKATQPRGGELWAVRDVSFEVERGEIVGLIGPNGAGKSTIFKLLSGITRPTEGRITMWGRTATLLEVGTGFHPELTGRENVFVNGAVLGMRRREIEARFDDIVEFSGIERFIDTPVKRYSSGMYVRLAFAVAAHLDPEILLVDEVLAVGDAEFQRKCLGKMNEASERGRTVVFVSHNLLAVQRLCSRAYVIDKGAIVAEGTAAEAVTHYLSLAGAQQSGGVAVIPADSPRLPDITGEAMLRRVTMTDREGHEISSVQLGQPFRVSLLIDAKRDVGDAVVEVGISTPDAQRVATVQNIDRGGAPVELAPGLNEIEMEVTVALLPGEYTLDLGLFRGDGVTMDFIAVAFHFTALNVPVNGETDWPWEDVRGYVRPTSTWSAARPVSEPAPEIAWQPSSSSR